MFTLYIAGPMKGLPDLNYPAFMKAEEQLLGVGYAVANPAHSLGPTVEEFTRQGLILLLRADGVALLDGWEQSVGANRERDVARWCGMPTQALLGWLMDAEPIDIPVPEVVE